MTPGWAHLLHALREPRSMADFDDATWDRVVRQAASAGLLGRLGALATLARAAPTPRVPAGSVSSLHNAGPGFHFRRLR